MATLPYSTMQPKRQAVHASSIAKRVYLAIAVALALATMAYGESWILEDAPPATLECAAVTGVAHAFDEPVATN